MIRIGLLITQQLTRVALVSLLKSLGFVDITEASRLDDLTQHLDHENAPEIFIVSLSGSSALTVSGVMSAVTDHASAVKVVFIAPYLNLKQLSECFSAGASGYLLENISGEALDKSLTLAAAGEKVFPSELASVIAQAVEHDGTWSSIEEQDHHDLSAREIQILQLLAEGQSNKLIAASLHISESTAKLYVKNVMRKLRATNRTQAVIIALRRGILSPTNIAHPLWISVVPRLRRKRRYPPGSSS